MAYCALTISKNIEEKIKQGETFSARNLHNRLNAESKLPPCSDGANLFPALNLLANYGCALSNTSEECLYTSAATKYDHKLFAYDKLKLNSRSIKSALAMNYPVVIAVSNYENGWENPANHEMGVWNGKRRNKQLGGHAMCIIGYNDTLSGGSFQIQNSWGESWGVNGYFWLRYSDLDIVVDAYAMRYTTSNTSNISIQQTQYFRVYNNSGRNCYLSVAKKIKNQWKSMGWYAVPVGEYYDYFIGDREDNDFFWMASADKNKIMWVGEEEDDRYFGFDPTKPFEYAEYITSEQKIKFRKASPTKSQKYFVQKLDLKEFVSRGSDKSFQTSSNLLQLDERAAEVANKDWKIGFCLFDNYSNEIINPQVDENGIIHYEVWFWQKEKLSSKLFTEHELQMFKEFKFGSEASAKAWKDGI
jgi:hypothetical protein